ncbi:MAG: hypothetical protein HN712_26715 [Gemmatimonadetes bacterium]|jgi:hypothetical protein|nr:hypothetical protein [Gemmatimonadota bacterium]MBT7863933.1 hypothetical protein [Gemmatimonadota bacterium]
MRCAAVHAQEPATWPDPTRYETTIAAFEAADAVSMPAPRGILAIGSSSIGAWHGTIERDLSPFVIIPRGFGGSVMNDVLHYVDRVVLPYRPNAILLYEGDNDVSRGISPDSIRVCFEALVARVHSALPETRFYVLSVKPSASRWHLWPQMERVNQVLLEACNLDSRLIYIDVASPFLGVDARPDSLLFRKDRLHLNSAGYQVWTAMVRPVLMAGEAQYESAD